MKLDGFGLFVKDMAVMLRLHQISMVLTPALGKTQKLLLSLNQTVRAFAENTLRDNSNHHMSFSVSEQL